MGFWFSFVFLVIMASIHGYYVDESSNRSSLDEDTKTIASEDINKESVESTTFQQSNYQTILLVGPSCRKGYMIIGGQCRKVEKLLESKT